MLTGMETGSLRGKLCKQGAWVSAPHVVLGGGGAVGDEHLIVSEGHSKADQDIRQEEGVQEEEQDGRGRHRRAARTQVSKALSALVRQGRLGPTV